MKHAAVRISIPVADAGTQTSTPYSEKLAEQNNFSPLVGNHIQPCVHVNSDLSSEESALLNDSNVNNSSLGTPQVTSEGHGHGVSVIRSRLNMTGGKGWVSKYLVALRIWSFPASITPVALGSCLAYKFQGVFNVYICLAAIFTALCVHAAGNLVNTYYDYVRGIDNKKSDDRTLVDNILSVNDVTTLGAILYVAGCSGCVILNFLSPAKMEHLALIYFCGLSSSFLYTGGLGLKYIAMGDILVVLTFGPLTVVFSYLSQTGQLSLIPLLYALPLALNTEAILHCNNARDCDIDRQSGIITLAILVGKTGSYLLFCLLLFLPYLLFITLGINYCPWMLLPASSIFMAFRLEKAFRRGELDKLPQKVAQLNLILGVFYIISLYFANPNFLPSISVLGSSIRSS